MKIIIELKNCDLEDAEQIKNEIEDKMLPDYDDSIKLIVVKNEKD